MLCVTQDLEGVYILAIDNLGVGLQEGREAAAAGETNAAGHGIKDVEGGADDVAGPPVGSSGGTRPTGAAAGRTARPTPRSAATSVFPSLLHLASRGQRRRAGPVAHTAAEPVFIASLARRGGGSGSKQGHDDGGRRRSSGSGRGSPGGKERRSSRASAGQLECLWWAARNGDHVAVIGRPDGEVLTFQVFNRLGEHRFRWRALIKCLFDEFTVTDLWACFGCEYGSQCACAI